MSAVAPRPPVPPGTRLRALAVLLLFLILMPPIGAAIFVAAVLSILHGVKGAELPSLLAVNPSELWFAMKLIGMFSYVFGGLQAAVVAVVAAVVQLTRPSDFVRFLPVLIASIVVAVVFVVIVIGGLGGRSEWLALVAFAVHVGAGIGAWLVANALLWPFRNYRPRVVAEPNQSPPAW